MKIYTSFVTPENMEKIVEQNLLPVFAIRKIYNSPLIGKYTNSAIHLINLSPTSELYQKKRDGIIGLDEFKKRFIIEVANRVNLFELRDRFELLLRVSGADGLVIMGYEEDPDLCHRSVIAGILNESGLFSPNLIGELVL